MILNCIRVSSQVSADGLVSFDGLKESLEVSGTKALMVATLDHLHEDRGTILQGLCEDLEEVALFIVVDENFELTDGFNVLCDLRS